MSTSTTSLPACGRQIKRLFSQIASINPSEASQWIRDTIENERDRFELWAVNLGLFVTGHGSLGYRLRDANELKATVQNFLDSLKEALEQAVAYWSNNASGRDVNPQIPGQDDELFEDLTEEDIQELGDENELILDGIRDPIDRLYKVSIWIRNPSSRFAARKALSHREIDPDTSVDLVRAFHTFDVDYVESVFRDLQRNSDEAAADRIVQNLWLVERIARANAQRRQQFYYWLKHRAKLQYHADLDAGPIPVSLMEKVSQLDIAPKEGVSRNIPSVTTATRLDVSLPIFQDVKSFADISNYAPSVAATNNDIVVFPEPPKARHGDAKEFECSYCYTICPEAMRHEQAWRAHLIHDLQPYLCTYQDCVNGDQRYDNLTDWVQHENTHAAVLSCFEHLDLHFANKDDLVKHMHEIHAGKAGVMVDLLNERGVTASVQSNRSCPICLRSMEKLKDLQNHVARHLERFSLFSIPRLASTDGQDGNSNIAAVDTDDEREEMHEDDWILADAESFMNEIPPDLPVPDEAPLNKSDANRAIYDAPIEAQAPESANREASWILPWDRGSHANKPTGRKWVKKLFHSTKPVTPFRQTLGRRSALHNSQISHWHGWSSAEGYTELIKIPFDSDVVVSFCAIIPEYLLDLEEGLAVYYIRGKDSSTESPCFPIHLLQISREKDCLQIATVFSPEQRMDRMDLRFASYEEMSIFHSAIFKLSLMNVIPKPVSLSGIMLTGESQLFECSIIADNYDLVLHVLKDMSSNGVRLTASNPISPMPIWTAFVNHKLPSLQWFVRTSPIQLRFESMSRFVFVDSTVSLTDGEDDIVVSFPREGDVDDFERVMRELAAERTITVSTEPPRE